MSTVIEDVVRSIASVAVNGIAAVNRWRLPARNEPHPLLTGVHEPMTEELSLTDLPVLGTIPADLDGRYFRIGPNPVEADPRSYHWFIGDGMVHGIRIAGGRAAWYRNRWIRSTPVAAGTGLERAPGPRRGGFDTVNTNIIGHLGSVLAMVEAGSTPVRLDEELGGQRYDDFDGTLAGSFTAHTKRDPLTGELHAVCYQATDPKRLLHVVIAPDGKVVRELVISVADGPLVHDCAITERFVIMLDLPMTLSMRTVLAGHGFPYTWNSSHPARLGLLPRAGAAEDLIWIELDPCFIFHIANAYDRTDGIVIMDAIVYDRMFVDGHDGPDQGSRGLERWVIDPVRRSVERKTIDASPQEFPRIDERRTGRPHRYIYTLALPEPFDPQLVGTAPLLKHDLRSGVRLAHNFGEGRVPGEFMFVPRNLDGEEDDGWLMGLVIDASHDTTALEIIDAQSFSSAPVASIIIPHRIPPGFHGNWIPSRQVPQASEAPQW
jgi:carotenoid cleavage dioxygenase